MHFGIPLASDQRAYTSIGECGSGKSYWEESFTSTQTRLRNLNLHQSPTHCTQTTSTQFGELHPTTTGSERLSRNLSPRPILCLKINKRMRSFFNQ